jgi:hypothetical protein
VQQPLALTDFAANEFNGLTDAITPFGNAWPAVPAMHLANNRPCKTGHCHLPCIAPRQKLVLAPAMTDRKDGQKSSP